MNGRRGGGEEVKEEKEQEVQEEGCDFLNLEVCERADRVLRSKASSFWLREGTSPVNTGAASPSTSWCEWVVSVTFLLVGFNLACQGSVMTLGYDCFALAPTEDRDPSEVWQWLPSALVELGCLTPCYRTILPPHSDPSHFLIRLSALSTIYTMGAKYTDGFRAICSGSGKDSSERPLSELTVSFGWSTCDLTLNLMV